jgi:aryl-alcohol dehydrogenase-like predicted oxidoreductase
MYRRTRLSSTGVLVPYFQKGSGLTRPVSVEELAKKKGITMAQVALAWILTKDGGCFSSS